MSAHLSKKATAKFQTPDTNIEALQGHLLKSLSTAFDPTATARSDDLFLAQDYSLSSYNETSSDPFAKNPYQALTEKARTYVEKVASEKPIRPKVKCDTNKKSDTFVTYLDVDSSMGNRRIEGPKEEAVGEYMPLAPITYDNILLGVTSKNEKEDDLEELRRMIKKTQRDMNAYGRELMHLKKDVVGVNDYAARELGYGANNSLMYSVENAANLLRGKSGLVSVNKDKTNSKSGKMDENMKRTSKTSNTNGALNSSGTAKKAFGTGVKATSAKGALRKW